MNESGEDFVRCLFILNLIEQDKLVYIIRSGFLPTNKAKGVDDRRESVKIIYSDFYYQEAVRIIQFLYLN